MNNKKSTSSLEKFAGFKLEKKETASVIGGRIRKGMQDLKSSRIRKGMQDTKGSGE